MMERPEFVCRETAARRLEISSDTFDLWVSTGFLPRATVNRGQIKRWHWPALVERLVRGMPIHETDPSVLGVINAKASRRAAS